MCKAKIALFQTFVPQYPVYIFQQILLYIFNFEEVTCHVVVELALQKYSALYIWVRKGHTQPDVAKN